MKYKTGDELYKIIRDFENCSIKRGDWGHSEHLILAYHYATGNDFDTAYDKMKTGILKLLKAFEVDLSIGMPYHETMTIFWMKTIFEYAALNPVITPASVHEMILLYDKHYPGTFYSHDLLMSESARTEWVEPDLKRMEN